MTTNSHTAMEIQVTKKRLEILQSNTPEKPLSITKIHQYLFADLYQWAGQIRNHPLWKWQNFCPENILVDELRGCTTAIEQHMTSAENIRTIIEQLAKDYSRLNWIHPFQDGNGRTQREFLRQNLAKNGFIIDLHNTRYKDMEYASKQGCLHNYKPFIDIFTQCIHKSNAPYDYYKQLSHLAILSCDDIPEFKGESK